MIVHESTAGYFYVKHKCSQVLLIAGLALNLLILSCVRPENIQMDKDLTIKSIEEFHARLNANQFSQIYDDAHQAFRESQTREGVIGTMRAVRIRFGHFQHISDSVLNVRVGAPIQIRAAYVSSFENGMATELFLFLKQKGKMQLASYDVYPGTAKLPTVH